MEAVQATPEDTASDLAELAADEAQTLQAIAILQAGGKGAYKQALVAVREDTAQWWREVLEGDGAEEAYSPGAAGLLRFLQEGQALVQRKRGGWEPVLAPSRFGGGWPHLWRTGAHEVNLTQARARDWHALKLEGNHEGQAKRNCDGRQSPQMQRPGVPLRSRTGPGRLALAAMANGRCRMHGALAGAPRGHSNASGTGVTRRRDVEREKSRVICSAKELARDRRKEAGRAFSCRLRASEEGSGLSSTATRRGSAEQDTIEQRRRHRTHPQARRRTESTKQGRCRAVHSRRGWNLHCSYAPARPPPFFLDRLLHQLLGGAGWAALQSRP